MRAISTFLGEVAEAVRHYKAGALTTLEKDRLIATLQEHGWLHLVEAD